MMNMVI